MAESQIELTLSKSQGLHSRPADLFVRTARLYASDITVHFGNRTSDAKNILHLLLLNVGAGRTIEIRASGSDASAAVEDLRSLVESDFSVVNEAAVDES